MTWLPKRASDGTSFIQARPLEASKTNLVSPNWCDKTTWYQSSDAVSDETMVDSGDHTTYELATPCASVDAAHGKLSHENELTAYRVVVKVDGVEKTENSPDDTDGDYSVDYTTTEVTFNTALAGTETVTISYAKVVDSKWNVVPTAGKVLRITEVEVQMSDDCVMRDTLNFQLYAEVGKFPPFEPYRQVNGGPYPDGTIRPAGNPVQYQTVMDLINEANGSFPIIPACGGTGWRGVLKDIMIFRWDYKATLDLRSDWGMFLQLGMLNDVEQGGWAAISTLYCVSYDL